VGEMTLRCGGWLGGDLLRGERMTEGAKKARLEFWKTQEAGFKESRGLYGMET